MRLNAVLLKKKVKFLLLCYQSWINFLSLVNINQRDAQILVNNLYFFVKWFYMFRTIISPSSGAKFNKLYSAIGTRRYVWLLYTAARRTGVYSTVQLNKCCS